MPRLALAALACLVLSTGLAHAEPYVFKHDQFHADFATALGQINGMSLAVQPGFAQGEAIGAMFRPSPTAFPLEITGVDLIFGGPPGDPSLTASATIEIYNSDQTGPAPGVAPIFSIPTSQLWNSQTQDFGVVLQGGLGVTVDFDLTDPQNHPPLITSGNLWVVIRFTDAPTSAGSSAWGVLGCIFIPGLTCGCQNVGALFDALTTPLANVIYHYTPLGACGGSGAWDWAESVGISGDFIIRLRANLASAPCVADCAGKVCGDDGCGGVCGPGCAEPAFCHEGACVTCLPNCIAKQCGDDGCGGSCGSCLGGDVCDAGWCVTPCVPDCTDKDCGADGCGGSCGSCAAGSTCTAAVCVADCVPDCAGRACGDDGCGGSCGGCVSGSVCSGGTCVSPCVPDCADRDCGADGCGGSCGSCEAGSSCAAGVCAADCAPDCAERACGADGCGGSCGACGAGSACADGACVAELALEAISPTFGFASERTPIALTGRGFAPGTSALVGGRALEDVVHVSSQVLTGQVPAGLNTGRYAVIVTTPAGASATLPDAFEVRLAPTRAEDGGCRAGGGAGGLALALAAALLIAVRRRRAVT